MERLNKSVSYHCSIMQIKDPTGGKSSRRVPTWLLARLALEKELTFIPHPYRSLSNFFEHHGLPRPKSGHWRLAECKAGYFRALHHSQGLLMSTNGILAYIEMGDGSLFLGHMDNFIPLALADSGEIVEQQTSFVKREEKFKETFEEFL